MAMCLLAGGGLVAPGGLPQRFAPAVQRLLAAADDRDPREHTCGGATLKQLEAGFVCVLGDARAKPSFAMWGDSHAAALIPVVSGVAARLGRAGYFVGHVGCAPLLGVTTSDEPSQRCARVNDAALALIARKNIREVIVAGRWAYYDTGRGTAADPRGFRRLFDLAGGGQHAVFARALDRTVARLSAGGRKVILVADVPEIDFDVPQTLARIALGAAPVEIRPTREAYRARQEFVAKDLAALQRRSGVAVIAPAAILCGSGLCAVEDGGRPLYRDHHHLTVFGAMRLAPLSGAHFDGFCHLEQTGNNAIDGCPQDRAAPAMVRGAARGLGSRSVRQAKKAR
ncbi:MAG: SGNH hydrolase domain-containing protein [Rhizomicrobium sp.]